MGKRLKKLKKIRLHHEGTHTLVWGAAGLIALNLLLFYAVPTRIPFNIAFFLSIIDLLFANIRSRAQATPRLIHDMLGGTTAGGAK